VSLLKGMRLPSLVPDRVGLAGNTAADAAAKATLNLSVTNLAKLAVPHYEHKCLVRSYLLNQWKRV